MKNENDLAFEATVDAITRTRRVLMLVSGIMALGYFHLIHWYFSWDKARIQGRIGIATALEERVRTTKVVGTNHQDSILAASFRASAEQISRSWSDRSVDVPPIGLSIAATDLSIAVMIASVAVLLWLLFYQRRVAWCLRRLDRLQGWGVAKGVLEYHFVLMGKETSHPMRWATRALLWGLPVLGICFLVSDVYDLSGILRDPVQRLAFSNPAFVRAVAARLCLNAILACLNFVLGLQCFRAYRNTEEDLLKFSRAETLT